MQEVYLMFQRLVSSIHRFFLHRVGSETIFIYRQNKPKKSIYGNNNHFFFFITEFCRFSFFANFPLRARVYVLYTIVKNVSCFIFMFQLIENQTFQEMKHWCSMFHFWFQCFIFYLPHPFPKNLVGEKSNPNGSDLKPQWERNKTPMGETPLKH